MNARRDSSKPFSAKCNSGLVETMAIPPLSPAEGFERPELAVIDRVDYLLDKGGLAGGADGFPRFILAGSFTERIKNQRPWGI